MAHASLALLFVLGAPAGASANERCVACHAGLADARLRAPVQAHAGDAHDAAQIGCVDCHRGDPDEETARAHDLSAGFVGRPSGLGVAMLCVRCHDDDAIDARYAGSPHARGVAAGGAAGGAAPTCTDCHGAHGVDALPRARVVATCGGCHASAPRMAGTRHPTDQVRQWSLSVHGRAAATGDEAPVCSGCHDAHAARAGLAAVEACGTCHAEIRAAFDRGPHGARFERLGFMDCVECHGSHEVRAPDRALLVGLDAVCSRCHGEGREGFAAVRRIASRADVFEGARRALGREDPRRRALVDALHALDAEGLEAAIAALPEAAVPATPTPPPAAPSTGERLRSMSIALGLALGGLFVVALLARVRRR